MMDKQTSIILLAILGVSLYFYETSIHIVIMVLLLFGIGVADKFNLYKTRVFFTNILFHSLNYVLLFGFSGTITGAIIGAIDRTLSLVFGIKIIQKWEFYSPIAIPFWALLFVYLIVKYHKEELPWQ